MEQLEIKVDESYLRKLAGKPISGIVELVANAFDADATQVTVEFIRNDLKGVLTITVSDNGLGMTLEEARRGFDLLGGSWKSDAAGTRVLHRPLLGKRGLGRFRIFGAGGSASWRTVAQESGEQRVVEITVDADSPKRAILSEPQETTEPSGTVVTLSDFAREPPGVEWEAASEILFKQFAVYLEKHSIEFSYDGHIVDPAAAIADRRTYSLAGEFDDDAQLDVVEWHAPPRSRTLCLCDEAGVALRELEVHSQTPGLKFTAYITWAGFGNHAGDLEAAHVDYLGQSGRVVAAAEGQIKEHYRRRLQEQRRLVVSRWQEEGVYPFEGAASDPVDRARRETFDIVAVAAEQTINAASSKESRKLSLRLVSEALEANPGRLHRILGEVLRLPQDRLDELDQLLDRTPLASIISASRTIANRLDFLRGLEMLVLDPEISPSVKERRELHKILADETWIFGDEFALTVNDQALRKVLEAHIKELNRDDLADEQPKDSEGRVCIVDLMLARVLPQARNRREHLVIELKAPKVGIGDTELAQIMRYSNAVARSPRFDTAQVDWDFVVVGSAVSETVERQRSQPNRPSGQVLDGKVRVWVRTWAEIIEDAGQRLKFVHDALEYAADDDRAVEYLRRTHKQLVPQAVPGAASVGDR